MEWNMKRQGKHKSFWNTRISMDTNKREKQEGKGKMKVKGKCLGNKILEATKKGEGET